MPCRAAGSACFGAITFSRALKPLGPHDVDLAHATQEELEMAYEDIRNRDADVKETHDLIASDKVEGT